MKTTLINSKEIVIQARNEADYQAATIVADLIVDNYPEDIALASCCPFEQFIHVTATEGVFTADDIRYFYNKAKKSLKG